LALAHIQAEVALEASLPDSRADLYAPKFVERIHAELYLGLPANERLTDDGAKLVPGALRRGLVTAGQHLAPAASDVPELLAAWQERYASLPGLELALVGAACSHQRLLWVHPFPDGNGRAARLHTHLVLSALGLTHGLWSPLRGMARNQEAYYARLNNADLPRRNDLDERGALSQEELAAFVAWFLELCLDQARFMRELLALGSLKPRLQELLLSLSAKPWSMSSETSVCKRGGAGGTPLHGDLRAGRARAFHGNDRPCYAHCASCARELARLRSARVRNVAWGGSLRGPAEEFALPISTALAGSGGGRRLDRARNL